ncbi:hypothetical protein IWZ01DRAFT_331951 [Phyllosticta capitalensis]
MQRGRIKTVNVIEQQQRRRRLRCDKKGADQDRVVAVASDDNHHHLKHVASPTSSPLAIVTPAPVARGRRRLADPDDDDQNGKPLTWTLRSHSLDAISAAPTTLHVVTSTSKTTSPTSAIGADAVGTSGAEWTISDAHPRPSVSSSSTRPSSTAAMGTTGLVIAAGCIGATLLVVTVAFGIYVMRTKGLTFSDVFRRKARPRQRIDRTYDIAKPTVHRMPAYAWDERKPPPSYSQSVPLRRPEPVATRFAPAASQSGLLTETSRCTPAASRSGLVTETSSRYTGTPAASQSGLLKPASRPSTPPGFKSPSNTSFLDDSTPPRNSSSRQSNHSREPSSPLSLPLQQQQQSRFSDLSIPPLFIQGQDPPRENCFYRSRESSVNLSRDNSLTRSRSDSVTRSRANSDAHHRSRDSSLTRQTQPTAAADDHPECADTLTSPHLPLPGFYSFMANRPGPASSLSQRPRGLTQSSHHSTFSPSNTTTSSPVDASFGPDPHYHHYPNSYRESTTSTATTTPTTRFRSVDSWVGHQTSRIESSDLRDQPPLHFSFLRQNTGNGGGGGLGMVDEGAAGWGEEAAPPDVPPSYRDGGGGGGGVVNVGSGGGVAGVAGNHRRQNTNHSDATVFRVHPGSEIKIPRGSLVPSEILDANMVHSAL